MPLKDGIVYEIYQANDLEWRIVEGKDTIRYFNSAIEAFRCVIELKIGAKHKRSIQQLIDSYQESFEELKEVLNGSTSSD